MSWWLRIGKWGFNLVVGWWFVFILLPILAVLIAAVNDSQYMTFPPTAFSLRWFQKALDQRWFIATLKTSLIVALTSSLIAAVLGILAARTLARHQFPGREVVEYIFLSPLIIPQIVLGFSLLQFFSALNWRTPLTNLLAAHILVTLPYIIRSVWSSMKGMSLSLEEASFSLGANPIQTFWHITLPLIRPGILAGFILAFTTSFNNVTLSIFLKGPGTSTLPVELMSYMVYNADPTPAAMATIMVLLAAVVFVLGERLFGIGMFAEA
jgi:putative spermidine/putrescine transport system permease protein